jgi:hypothetical protein
MVIKPVLWSRLQITSLSGCQNAIKNWKAESHVVARTEEKNFCRGRSKDYYRLNSAYTLDICNQMVMGLPTAMYAVSLIAKLT